MAFPCPQHLQSSGSPGDALRRWVTGRGSHSQGPGPKPPGLAPKQSGEGAARRDGLGLACAGSEQRKTPILSWKMGSFAPKGVTFPSPPPRNPSENRGKGFVSLILSNILSSILSNVLSNVFSDIPMWKKENNGNPLGDASPWPGPTQQTQPHLKLSVRICRKSPKPRLREGRLWRGRS